MTQLLGTLGNIDELSIGGRIITNVPSPTNSSTTLITLTGYVDASGEYATLRTPNGTSGYQVTSGKTLTIVAVQVNTEVSGSAGVQLGYGSTDIGFASTTLPSAPIYFGGDANNVITATPNVGSFYAAPNFQIPSGQYPLMFNGSANGRTSFTAYGYEA